MIGYKEAIKLILICVAAVLFNVAFSHAAQALNLPVYLDTVGTVFIAALGGYVPGIAVGFFSNVCSAFFDVNEMYYSFVSVTLAMFAAFFSRHGYFDKFHKVLFTIPAAAIMTSFFGALLEDLLSVTTALNSLGEFAEHFQRNFFYEIIDKGAAIIASFFLLKLVPQSIKENFQILGRKQAPLDDEIQQELKRKKYFTLSLRTKLLFNLMACSLLVAVSITTISYLLYEQTARNERIRIADGITSMVVSEINPYHVDEYLKLGRAAEDYNEVERKLYRIRASNSDIKYLYVYKIEEDGCHVVFDLSTADTEGSDPGSVEEFDEEFYALLPDLLAGKPIPPKISNGQFGYLLTIYKPVYNHNGQCVCYAAIDFSMDTISEYVTNFTARIVALFSGFFILVFMTGLAFIENNIILPVNTMAYCAKNFSYESKDARKLNVARLENLDIRTDDEIENLYTSLVKSIEDGMTTFDRLHDANIRVAVMDKLAHTDSLTGIGNKTAYAELTVSLDRRIANGDAKFSIVMLDVNFLKKINDTYGHEYGNEYLINACKLACKIFSEENVFRVGGDEFVAVLVDDDVKNSDVLVAQFNAELKKLAANKSLQPWEKLSVAVGVATYEAGVDKEVDEVFKRADALMYANKLAMKAERRD